MYYLKTPITNKNEIIQKAFPYKIQEKSITSKLLITNKNKKDVSLKNKTKNKNKQEITKKQIL